MKTCWIGPAAAAAHPKRTCAGPLGIADAPRRIGGIPVAAPLPHISTHVVQAPCVWLGLPNWMPFLAGWLPRRHPPPAATPIHGVYHRAHDRVHAPGHGPTGR